MFLLFSFLFFSIFLFSLFLGFYLMDYSGVCFELLMPYSLLSEMPFSFFIDYVSLFFFSAVSLISSVVFLYSKFYMDDSYSEMNFLNSRFFYLLFLFVVSMLFLVFSGSWVVVMLGWDGLGLVSFLLVIYYNNSSSLDSGLITVFTNRVGDCLFILSFMFMFYSGWVSLDFLTLESCMFFSFLIFIGCVTKSAQLPFSSWLPAAMAAPTPVSSLVHSSTLVTAGVYLLIRFNFLLDSIYFFLVPLSLFTMFLAGACAVYELDFKKVVAMSTLSQLGFMIFSISSGYWLLGFLHMTFHAFFKSSLFLSTGNLMHYLLGDQDSRNFGSLGSSFFSKLLFSMSSLSLMGFPFSLGFYSKDTILGELLFSSFSFISFLFIMGCCFTVAYSLRLVFMGFMNFPSFSNSLSFSEDKFFYLPIIFLYLTCVFFGNFFFFYFLPPVVFSFLDFFLGIFIIFFGFIVYLYSPNFYSLLSSMMSISFLSIVSSSVISNFTPYFYFKGEYSWGEILGGKGSLVSMNLLKVYAIRLYALHFAPLVMIGGLIYMVLK
uniref:NADH dehydrogenase subunit 5 n=1 Tax=Sancassania mycophaga TaxID=3127633 RepID=UPI00315DB864